MKKRLIALLLSLTLLLSGCNGMGLQSWFAELNNFFSGSSSFSDMVYTRPNIQTLKQAAQEIDNLLSAQADADTLMDAVYGFYGEYNSYYTNYALANIYYCKDLTDIYWEQEYNYCLSAAAQADALLDQMLYTLADCPLREELEHPDRFGEGYFDPYLGESIWDDTFTSLMDMEATLETKYYELSTQALSVPAGSETFYETYGTQMAALLAELVNLRQEIAQEAGYDNYLSFAYDYIYQRDYSPAQADILLANIQTQLVPLYRRLAESDLFTQEIKAVSQQSTFSYVKNAANAMGGDIKDAFACMENGGLYDIGYGKNKFDASFEVYLINYGVPYVFLNPLGTSYDHLTFAHEFGHFCNDYVSMGTMTNIDVAEVFSQGMEYLTLCYGTEELQRLKFADCLCIYVEQAAYASFEHALYTTEDLTADKVYALYEQIGTAYGFDTWQWDSRSFVNITHFFTDPVYVISYVVSNDGALQLYQLEQAKAGDGLAKYQAHLDTQQVSYLAFLEEAQLESPFSPTRLDRVKNSLEAVLFP